MKNRVIKNKIIKQYLLPRFVFVGMWGVALVPVIYGVTDLKNKIENKVVQNTAKDPMFLSLITLVAGLIGWYVVGMQKDANKMAISVAREYINKAIKEHPDLEDFASVLSNDRAMRYVAATIANNLRPSEQKQLKETLMRTQSVVEPLKMEDAYKQVEQIIKDHIHVHPEFLPELYGEMAYAEHTYVLPTMQKVR